jgi:hypothetical protein
LAAAVRLIGANVRAAPPRRNSQSRCLRWFHIIPRAGSRTGRPDAFKRPFQGAVCRSKTLDVFADRGRLKRHRRRAPSPLPVMQPPAGQDRRAVVARPGGRAAGVDTATRPSGDANRKAGHAIGTFAEPRRSRLTCRARSAQHRSKAGPEAPGQACRARTLAFFGQSFVILRQSTGGQIFARIFSVRA